MTEREKELESALRGLLGWASGGRCSDCDMFREAPSCIEFVHHRDCGHLESINQARALLGLEPEEFHTYDNPEEIMHLLAIERSLACQRDKK